MLSRFDRLALHSWPWHCAEKAIITPFLHQTSCPDEKKRGPQFTSNIERFYCMSDEKMDIRIKWSRKSKEDPIHFKYRERLSCMSDEKMDIRIELIESWGCVMCINPGGTLIQEGFGLLLHMFKSKAKSVAVCYPSRLTFW